MDTMAAIKQTFFQECEEQLIELESGLLALDGGTSEPDTINAVFRAVHSIKGGAGAFGLEQLVRFAHTYETSLDLVRSGKIAASRSILKTMLTAADTLADLVRSAREDVKADDGEITRMVQQLESACGLGGAHEAPVAAAAAEPDLDFTPIQVSLDDLFGGAGDAKQSYRVRFEPKTGFYSRANEPLVLLREMARLGETQVTCDLAKLPTLAELDPEGAYLAWDVVLETDASESAIRDIFEFVEFDCDISVEKIEGESAFDDDAFARLLSLASSDTQAALPEPVEPVMQKIAAEVQSRNEEAAARKAESAKGFNTAGATIRVDLDRVERLIDLVGELVINQAMLSQRVAEARIARSSALAMGLDDLEQLSREIQDSVMAIRAQPVKPIFQRMSRVVREAADMTGKSVMLQCDGEATEVDKTVIERLTDPLTHMIRNAIDHGIEKPEARLAAGKPETGHIRLAAMHRSGRVVIEISDDGGGINRERVKSAAIAKGLIDPDAQMSDEDIDNLIFLPGFSTASTVADMSGRGVGMDVVKRSIQALGGRITISSTPGKGSAFVMSLPLTLAVLDGMIVSVAEETLIVPLTAIVETLKPSMSDIFHMGGDSRVIRIRDSFVPLIDIGHVLGYRQEMADPSNCVIVLIDLEGQARRALLVDAIQGQRQVVIKSLEANYRRVDGIAAATILGDGRVALILDVDAVVENADGKSNPPSPDPAPLQLEIVE
ncbi:MAG: cheA [Hyphomicrobiales bacterium]|nr:cheA [Hyphomicrobiales bacterium]